MADTPNGETATPEVLENKVTPAVAPATPPVTTTDESEVEKLRKEKEQAEMRTRQLENEKAARDKADDETRQKQLQEDNQFKELFEQEKTKREALELDQQTREREAELSEAKQEALSGFSEDVKKTAGELGLELVDTDEASIETFKGKLEKLSQKVSGESKVTPNNPNPSTPKTNLTTEQLQQGLQDDKTFHDIVTSQYPGIAAMTSSPRVAK